MEQKYGWNKSWEKPGDVREFVGQVVLVVDEGGRLHDALVTAWHGYPKSGSNPMEPVCNVIFVSSDEAKNDPYGRQVERLSSVCHRSQVGACPGRFWFWAGEYHFVQSGNRVIVDSEPQAT